MASRAVPWLALLLICIAAVTPGSSQEQEDHASFPGACHACKYIVRWVKSQLGKDSSKEKIGALLNRVCLRIKTRFLQRGCKWVVKRVKNKLINAIANRGSPLSVCRQLRLCKRRPLLLNCIIRHKAVYG